MLAFALLSSSLSGPKDYIMSDACTCSAANLKTYTLKEMKQFGAQNIKELLLFQKAQNVTTFSLPTVTPKTPSKKC